MPRCSITRATGTTSRAIRSPPRMSRSSTPAFSPMPHPIRGWAGMRSTLISLFTSVGLWRQQHGQRPGPRHHREGGTAANIIPDRTVAWFMIRSDNGPSTTYARTLPPDVRGGRARHRYGGRGDVLRPGYVRNNLVLAQRFRANMAAYGMPTRATTSTPAPRTWLSAGFVHDPPGSVDRGRGTPGHSSSSATPRRPARRRDPLLTPPPSHRPDRLRALRRRPGRRRLAGIPPKEPESRGRSGTNLTPP